MPEKDPSEPAKMASFTVRADRRQMTLIDQAAKMLNLSRSSFVRAACMIRAFEIHDARKADGNGNV